MDTEQPIVDTEQPASSAEQPAENYRWWQNYGNTWPGEVGSRKRTMPIYHIQEVFLAEYFGRSAPASVLDFGCGFGRHLSYLSRMPGLQLAGCDQSASMVAGMREWASEQWIAEHVKITEPLAPLPYPDKSFDIVFTVSVLIHIRPEDVAFVLSELVRVCRWQIIHIENNNVPETALTAEAHQGCWEHPLIQHYEALGCRPELLPKPFEIEDVYRVVLDAERPVPNLGSVTIGKLLTLDRTISQHINELLAVKQNAEQETLTLHQAWRDNDTLLRSIEDLQAQLAQLGQHNATLEQRLHEQEQREGEVVAGLEARLHEQEQRESEAIAVLQAQAGQLGQQNEALEMQFATLQAQRNELAWRAEQQNDLAQRQQDRLVQSETFAAQLRNLLNV